jgi:hypothetical protein
VGFVGNQPYAGAGGLVMARRIDTAFAGGGIAARMRTWAGSHEQQRGQIRINRYLRCMDSPGG